MYEDDDAQHDTASAPALLITCLRGAPFVISPDTDWQALLSLAEAHGVSLVLAQIFHEKQIETPAFFTAAVRERTAVTEALASELENLLNQFAERQIEVLPLKGPALAKALYGDVAMRPCDDLDLLVRREDLSRAEKLLLDMGFAAPAEGDDYHRKFIRDGLMVELHFEVASPRSFLFDLAGLWSRTRSGEFQGAHMRVMADEDLVLFLCLHGLKHGFSRLIWILDLAHALGKMQAEGSWELAQHARQQGLEQVLLIGCEVVREVFPQQLPQELEAVLAASPEAAERARRAVAQLLVESTGRNNDPEIWSFYLHTESRASGKWRRRLTFFVPTAGDYAWAERHGIYRGLMPALRPFRLLHKYGASRAWRILFPPPV